MGIEFWAVESSDMTEEERLKFDLSAKLLRLMQNEKIPFEKKTGTMDYLIKMGADVNAKVFGKTMALWAKELGDKRAIQFVKENNGKKEVISKEDAESLGKQFWDENGELKSVKEIKNLVMQGANLGMWCYETEAEAEDNYQIWKDLSEDEIKEVVKILPRGYVIDGDVDLEEKSLVELPDFSNVKVNGCFYCDYNKLITLDGAPREVGWDFWCNKNQLISLEGAPSKVGGDFDCRENQLTSLESAPSEVGQDFDCSSNQLTTLEGAPSVVDGNFDCRENQLISLKGKPEKISGEFRIEDEVLRKIERQNIKKTNEDRRDKLRGRIADLYELE